MRVSRMAALKTRRANVAMTVRSPQDLEPERHRRPPISAAVHAGVDPLAWSRSIERTRWSPGARGRNCRRVRIRPMLSPRNVPRQRGIFLAASGVGPQELPARWPQNGGIRIARLTVAYRRRDVATLEQVQG